MIYIISTLRTPYKQAFIYMPGVPTGGYLIYQVLLLLLLCLSIENRKDYLFVAYHNTTNPLEIPLKLVNTILKKLI